MYFTMKTRETQPLNFGIGWFDFSEVKQDDGTKEIKTKVQTECRHKGEDVHFKYLYHNGKDYAKEEITDTEMNLKINVEMIKLQYDSMEDQQWHVNVKTEILDSSKGLLPSIEAFVFVTTDRKNGIFNPQTQSDGFKLTHAKSSKGKKNMKWEKFTEQFNIYNSNHKERSFIGVELQSTWNINSLMDKLIKMNRGKLDSTFADSMMENSNIFIYKWKPDGNNVIVSFSKSLNERQNSISTREFSREAQKLQQNFISEFQSKFKTPEQDQKFSIEILSQLISGLGYYYGSIKTSITEGAKVVKTDPAPLFTCSPSRTIFPRGFLWDEGFHQLVLSQWDPNLTIDVIWHWLDTIQYNGWIPREQIRGDEAESYVPQGFLVQNQDVANPPSLLLVYESLLSRLQAGEFKDTNLEQSIKVFFAQTFDKLELWFNWFKKSQENYDVPFTFQWKGRSREHNFPSGLDDYPRALQPSKREIHLDLQSWMATLTKTLSNLSIFLEKPLKTQKTFFNYTTQTIDQMNKRLFNPQTQLYSDFLGFQWNLIPDVNSTMVPPITWRRDGKCGPKNLNHLGLPATCDAIEGENLCCKAGTCKFLPDCVCKGCTGGTVRFKDDVHMRKENQFNYHQGIVNLFPLMFGLIDPSDERIKSTLEFLFSQDKMMSPYGVRSLSKQDLLFHKDEDYWRGNIWINVNYLVYRGLMMHYPDTDLTINQVSLKENIQMFKDSLVGNVKREFERTGWLWEQYNESLGNGQRGHPFSGWTSLVLLIIADKY